MRITEVKYQRVKNLGNYETERVELVAELNEGDDHKKVLFFLQNQAEIFLGLENE